MKEVPAVVEGHLILTTKFYQQQSIRLLNSKWPKIQIQEPPLSLILTQKTYNLQFVLLISMHNSHLNQTTFSKTAPQTTYQKVFVINSPKLIRFIYKADAPTQSPNHMQLITNNVPNNRTSKLSQIELGCSRKRDSFREPKIKLVSKRSTELGSQNSNLSKVQKKKSIPPSQEEKCKPQTHENALSSQKSHIKSESIIESFNCGLFSGCGQSTVQQQLDYYPSKMRKIESRLIYFNQPNINNDLKIASQEIEPEPSSSPIPSIHVTNLFHNISKQRKRIFDVEKSRTTIFNRSLDCFRELRSHSRKSIFSHYSAKSRCSSCDSSSSKRKKIFQPRSLQRQCKRLKQLRQETIEDIEVPQSILQNWKLRDEAGHQSIKIVVATAGDV